MRTVRQHELGGPEVLVVEEVERPEPGPTEVLVRGAAAGGNPVDWKTRSGGGGPVDVAAGPERGRTEVLVRVAAAGVNPVDWKTRSGGGFLREPPFTLGWDVAGVGEGLGFRVHRAAPGGQ